MKDRILLVDDDSNILNGYKRALHKKFSIVVALGGNAALEIISNNDPFAVVVSDMRMPGMDGIQFLTKVKGKAPDTTRIMLTGNSDQDTAVNAVNEGNIFRFLCKPCTDEILERTLVAGIEQYQLKTAEKELLEKTVRGSIDILTELISILNPELFERTIKVKELMKIMASYLQIPKSWEMEVASMLSPIGYLGVPTEILNKLHNKDVLSDKEKDVLNSVPELGRDLVRNIPRLESISNIILFQNKRFDGSGFPKNPISGTQIPFGGRLLKILSDLIEIENNGTPRKAAFQQLHSRKNWYDPEILKKVSLCFLNSEDQSEMGQIKLVSVDFKDLEPGNLLMSDIETEDGTLLLTAGNRVSHVKLVRLKNYKKMFGIKEPIQIETQIKD